MERAREHRGDDEIVELLAAISRHGLRNRLNDSMATDLADGAREVAERALANQPRDGGKHAEEDRPLRPKYEHIYI